MRAALIVTVACIAASSRAGAAPRTPYGGVVVAYVLGPASSFDPSSIASASEASIATAIWEPLYQLDAAGQLEPALARALPEIQGTRMIVPLRAGAIFHDGRAVTAVDVVRSLERLLGDRSLGAHVLLPVRGARERLRGDASAKLGLSADDAAGTVVFELAEAYPEYARLLASPRAAVAGDARARGIRTGTGPFRVDAAAADAADALVLSPFLGHRDGRPFLDGIVVRPSASRFGAASVLRRQEATLLFGVPDAKPIAGYSLLGPSRRELPRELVVLSIGRQLEELRSADGVARVGAAIDRAVLAHRFIGDGAEPASDLFGEAREEPRSGAAAAKRVDATLLVAGEQTTLRRVAERIQVDLLRAGVTVIISRVPAQTLEARRRDGRYDLLVDSIVLDGPYTTSAIDRLHALLSAGSPFGGAANVIDESELKDVLHAQGAAREAIVRKLEVEARLRLGLVPLATRSDAIAVRADLSRWSITPFGAIDLADAFMAAKVATEAQRGKPR